MTTEREILDALVAIDQLAISTVNRWGPNIHILRGGRAEKIPGFSTDALDKGFSRAMVSGLYNVERRIDRRDDSIGAVIPD